MSHKATYWLATVDPKRITAGAFRVLFHLCDHHNGEREPERACFPSQETLLDRTGMSNAGLNKCLNALSEAGLLGRNRSTIPGTAIRRTYYILGCDMDADTKLTPQSGDSPNSTAVEAAPELTPLLTQANSTFEGGKLHSSGEEPVRNRERTSVCSENPPPHTQFAKFMEFHPRPRSREECADIFEAALASGVSLDWIIASAKKYADENRGNKTQYLAYADNWLRDGRWADFPEPDPEAQKKLDTLGHDADARIADAIRSKTKPYLWKSLSQSKLADLIAVGLLEPVHLREAGL